VADQADRQADRSSASPFMVADQADRQADRSSASPFVVADQADRSSVRQTDRSPSRPQTRTRSKPAKTRSAGHASPFARPTVRPCSPALPFAFMAIAFCIYGVQLRFALCFVAFCFHEFLSAGRPPAKGQALCAARAVTASAGGGRWGRPGRSGRLPRLPRVPGSEACPRRHERPGKRPPLATLYASARARVGAAGDDAARCRRAGSGVTERGGL
jgi:hypothetical protein